LLVAWYAGYRCDMVGSDEDRGRSRRPGAKDQRWSSTGWLLGGRTIERSGDVVCGLHRAEGDEERGFPSSALKPRSMVSPSLASKPVATGFPVWPSKPSGLWFVGSATKLTGG
jgi:hypothetical protein